MPGEREFPDVDLPGNLRLPGDSHRNLGDLLAALKQGDAASGTAAERVSGWPEEGRSDAKGGQGGRQSRVVGQIIRISCAPRWPRL